jgi:hypothetical protein
MYVSVANQGIIKIDSVPNVHDFWWAREQLLVDDRRERVSRKQTELLSEQFFKCADGDKISIYTHY